jgi:hypothetical protein
MARAPARQSCSLRAVSGSLANVDSRRALGAAETQASICRDGGAEVAALFAMSNVTLMQSMLGHTREALEHARSAIEALHALGADAGAGHLYFSEMIALLVLDRTGEALVAARNAYPRLMREGDHYRILLPLVLLNALQGRLEVAARVAGFDATVRSRSGENETIWAPLLHPRVDALLSAGLSRGERARLAAEGAALSDEAAFKLLWATADIFMPDPGRTN